VAPLKRSPQDEGAGGGGSIRDRSVAAPLKPAQFTRQARAAVPIRGRTVAAPLKLVELVGVVDRQLLSATVPSRPH